MNTGEFILEGVIDFIDPKKDVAKKEGTNFFVQTVGLDTTTSHNGRQYKGYAGLQFAQDNCKLLEGVVPGDKVKVAFEVNGTFVKKDTQEPTEMNKESKNAFNNLNVYKLRVIQKAGEDKPSTGTPADEDDLPF